MLRLLILTVFVTGTVLSLQLEDAEEGSCRGIRYKALPHVDLDFVDSLNYIPALNRYHLYRHASSHPRFREMREFELYYKACLTQNTTYSVGDGTAFGFGGRPLGSYTVRPRREQPTIIDTTPIVGSYDHSRLDRLQQYITLTDHRTFAFLANCWVGSDQRSFDVFSMTPDLSHKAKRMIEEHAVSLGFKRDQIVFLNYDSCGGGGSEIGGGDHLSHHHDHLGIGGGLHSEERGKPSEQFGSGLGWSSNLVSGRNHISAGSVQYPHIPLLPGAGTRKIVTSRATINPIPGNNSLRRGNNIGLGGAGASGRLSLASSVGAGWTK